ncbi:MULTISPECIES: hypothetical protein [Neisseria]|uniref:Uncharacterized protein n=1 Tax=Neisseria polysaccharea TaxID=489 RepID=A0ABV1JJU6_NEIPO|nr:hypothetical protein [Neisseria polysaccharea]MBS0040313.1 hypothetical protein [Neisseria sp. Marseille-Q1983]
MKRIISLFLLACPVLVSAAPDNDKAALQAVIAKYYNRPLAAHKCWLAKPPKDSGTVSDNIMYCMKPVADHTVTRNGKATRYVLYTGFAYDMQQKVKQGAHASSGLAELFVLEKADGEWAIKQHGKDEIGAWGEPPENKEWKFVQVGAQNWGYVAESSYTSTGSTSTSQNFLFTDDSNRVRKSLIVSGDDNGGFFGDCNELKGREKRLCEDAFVSLEAEITFDKSRPAVSGVWALTAKLSGVSGKKKYKNQKYVIPYNGKTHVVPKNYGL